MTKWTGKSRYPPEQEKERRRMVEEAERDREYRKRLCAIMEKLDLYGEDSLTDEEHALVQKHREFFYPEEEV